MLLSLERVFGLIQEYSNSSRDGIYLCNFEFFLRIKFLGSYPADLIMQIFNDAMMLQVEKYCGLVDKAAAKAGTQLLNRQDFWFHMEQVSSDSEDEIETIPILETLQNHFD